MQLEFHQIDAFTDRPFRGNPAVVYRLDTWLEDELMQRIAAPMVGGMVTAPLLSLLVLTAAYGLMRRRALDAAGPGHARTA